MRVKIVLLDAPIMSKQHSSKRSNGANGRMMFTVKKYSDAKRTLHWLSRAALMKKGWLRPVAGNVALRISYRANRMNADNVSGFVMDALEGAAYLKDGQVDILSVRKRRPGKPWLGITIHTLEAKHGRRTKNHAGGNRESQTIPAKP